MPRSQRLSLADAQRLAFEKNWDLLAAAAGVDAATAQKIVAREFPNPTLSQYSSLINVDNHPSSTSEGNGVVGPELRHDLRHQPALRDRGQAPQPQGLSPGGVRRGQGPAL